MQNFHSSPFGILSFGSVLLLLIIGSNPSLAFMCYKCTSNENELCIHSPNELAPSAAIVECEGYCTILRTEFTDIPGEVAQLLRDCSEEEPLVLNDIRTDKHYTKMYTSCTTDRCNSGDGTREPGTGSGGNTGPKNIIIVDEQNSGIYMQPSFMFVVGTMLIYSIYFWTV